MLFRSYLAHLVGDSEPAISSDYDVYLADGDLIYAKWECDADDTDAAFFLHIYPVDAADRPSPRKRHGFDNMEFVFDTPWPWFEIDGEFRGTRYGDLCIVDGALPDYDIAQIRTGQFVHADGERLWEGEINLR